jgi:hypothetical protein
MAIQLLKQANQINLIREETQFNRQNKNNLMLVG